VLYKPLHIFQYRNLQNIVFLSVQKPNIYRAKTTHYWAFTQHCPTFSGIKKRRSADLVPSYYADKRKNNPMLKSIRLWITPPHEEGGDLQAV